MKSRHAIFDGGLNGTTVVIHFCRAHGSGNSPGKRDSFVFSFLFVCQVDFVDVEEIAVLRFEAGTQEFLDVKGVPWVGV